MVWRYALDQALKPRDRSRAMFAIIYMGSLLRLGEESCMPAQ